MLAKKVNSMKRPINIEDEIYSHNLRVPEFPNNLTNLMKMSSSTTKDFALRYDVTVGSVNNWLAGRSFPRKEVLTAICKEYRIPLLKLVGEPVEVEYTNVYSMKFKR